jgi:hypothetical protein
MTPFRARAGSVKLPVKLASSCVKLPRHTTPCLYLGVVRLDGVLLLGTGIGKKNGEFRAA